MHAAAATARQAARLLAGRRPGVASAVAQTRRLSSPTRAGQPTPVGRARVQGTRRPHVRLTSVHAASPSPTASPQGGGNDATLSPPAFVGTAALAVAGAMAWQAGWVGALKVSEEHGA
jgi:hypothetical protein